MAGKSYNVGNATIKVRPDLTGFRQDLRKQLNKRKAHVEFDTELNDESLDKEREKLRRADFKASVDLDMNFEWAKFKAKIRERNALDRPKVWVDLDVRRKHLERFKADVELKPDYASLRRKIAEWNATGNRPKVWVDVDAATAGARTKIAALTRPEKKTVKVDVDVTAFDMAANRLASRLSSVGNTVGRLQLIAGALTAIGVGASGAIPEVATFGRELGIAAQSAYVLPAALGAVAATAGAAYLAMGNFSDVVSSTYEQVAGQQIMPDGMEELKAASEDMKFTGEATVEAAKAVNQFNDAWNTMRGTVENSFFAGMTDTFKAFANANLPLLQAQLSGMSASMGAMVRGWMDFRSTDAGLEDMNVQLSNYNSMLSSMVNGVSAFGQAWNDIATVGSTFMPGFGRWFSSVTRDFASWTENARETGRLAELMERGFQAVGNVGKIIGGTFGLFGDILGVASKDADQLAQHMVSVLGSTREWAQSIEGQDKIAKFFADATRTGNEFMGIIGSIGELVAEHFAPAMAEFMEGFGPRLQRLIDSFAPILDAITPSMQQVGAAMGDLLLGTQAMGIAFAPLIYTLLPAAAGAFRMLAPAIGGLTAPVTTLIALTLAMKKMEPFFAAFAAFSTRPWGPLVLGISAASAAIAGLYVTFEPFRDLLDAVIDGFKSFNDMLGGVPGRVAVITASFAAASLMFRRLRNSLMAVDMTNLVGPGGQLRNNLTPIESMRASYATFMGTMGKYRGDVSATNAADRTRSAQATATASKIVAANNTVFASNQKLAASNAQVAASASKAAASTIASSAAASAKSATSKAASSVPAMDTSSVTSLHVANLAAIESAKRLSTATNGPLQRVAASYKAGAAGALSFAAAQRRAADAAQLSALRSRDLFLTMDRMGSQVFHGTIAGATRMASVVPGTFGVMKSAASGAFGLIRRGASSLISLIGGKLGATLIAGTVLIQGAMSEIKKINDYRDISLDVKMAGAEGAIDMLNKLSDGAELLGTSTTFIDSFGQKMQQIGETKPGWFADFANGAMGVAAIATAKVPVIGDALAELAAKSTANTEAQKEAAAVGESFGTVLKELGMTSEDVARAASGSSTEWENFMGSVRDSSSYVDGVDDKFNEIRESIEQARSAMEYLGPAGVALSDSLAKIGQGGKEAEEGLLGYQRALSLISGADQGAADTAERMHSNIQQALNNAGQFQGAQLNDKGQLDLMNGASAALSGQLFSFQETMHQMVLDGGNAAEVFEANAAALDQMKVSSGLVDAEWNKLMRTHGLTAESLRFTEAIQDLDQVNQGVAMLGQAMERADLSGTEVRINAEDLDDGVKQRLIDLGAELGDFQFNADGTVKIDVDDEEARDRINYFATDLLPRLDAMEASPIMSLDDTDFKPNLEQAALDLAQLDGETVTGWAELNTDSIPQSVLDALYEMEILDSAEAEAFADLNWSELDTEQKLALAALFDLDGQRPEPKADLNPDLLHGKVREADRALNNDIKQTRKPEIDGNDKPIRDKIATLIMNPWPAVKISVQGVWQGIIGAPMSVSPNSAVVSSVSGGTRAPARPTGGQTPYATGGEVTAPHGGYKLPTTGPGTNVVDGFLGVNMAGMPIARVNAGEWVINSASSERYSRELAAINAGTFPKLPGYAGGGIVLDQFARGLEGQPYEWGGIRWGDCSGAQSALARFSVGLDPWGGRFATASQAGELAKMGFISGKGSAGDFRIGWYNGGPWGGHTSSTLPTGVNAEMGGARGNGQYGGGAAGVFGPGNNEFAYLPSGWFDKVFVPDFDEVDDAMAKHFGASAVGSTPASLDRSESGKSKDTISLEDLPEEDFKSPKSISEYAGDSAASWVSGKATAELSRRKMPNDLDDVKEFDLSNNKDVEYINRDVQRIQFGDLKVNKLTLRTPEMHQLLAGRGKAYDPNFFETDPSKVERDGSLKETKTKLNRMKKQAAADTERSVSHILGSTVGDFVKGQVADLLDVFGISDTPPWFKAWADFQEAWHKRVYTAKDRRYKILQVQDAAADLRQQYPDVKLSEIDPKDMPHMRPDESLLSNYGGGDPNVMAGRIKYEELLKGRDHKDVVKELRARKYDPAAGAGQWRQMVQAAMYENGMDPSNQAHVDAVMREIAHQSGGNPRKGPKNPGQQKGEGSKVGLLGVTDAQMERYGDGLDGDKYDPWVNLNVAMRNYVARNGSNPSSNWGNQEEEKRRRSEAAKKAAETRKANKSAQRRATGGWITGFGGPTQDNIRVLASAGEYMVNAFSAREAGPLLQAINADPALASAMQAVYDGQAAAATSSLGISGGSAAPHIEYHIHASNVDEGMNRARMHERQLASTMTIGR